MVTFARNFLEWTHTFKQDFRIENSRFFNASTADPRVLKFLTESVKMSLYRRAYICHLFFEIFKWDRICRRRFSLQVKFSTTNFKFFFPCLLLFWNNCQRGWKVLHELKSWKGIWSRSRARKDEDWRQSEGKEGEKKIQVRKSKSPAEMKRFKMKKERARKRLERAKKPKKPKKATPKKQNRRTTTKKRMVRRRKTQRKKKNWADLQNKCLLTLSPIAIGGWAIINSIMIINMNLSGRV